MPASEATKIKQREYSKRYYREHGGPDADRERERNRTPKRKQQRKEATQRWRAKDRDNDKVIQFLSNCKGRAPDVGRATVQEVKDLLLTQTKCQICGTEHRLTIDHIISLANGGDSLIDNLQILCLRCNVQKG